MGKIYDKKSSFYLKKKNEIYTLSLNYIKIYK